MKHSLYNQPISRNTKLLLCMIAAFSLGQGAYWVLLNLFLKESGFAEGFIGQVTGLISVGTMMATIPMAWLCGRKQIKWLIIISIFINVLGDLLLIFAEVEWLIQLGAIVSGVGFAAWITATAPFVMRNTLEIQRGRIFSYKHGLGLFTSGLASVAFAFWVDKLVLHGMVLAAAYTQVLLVASLFKLTAVVFGLFIIPQDPRPEERRDLKDFITARDWNALFKLTSPMLLIGFGAGMTMPFMNLYFRERFQIETGMIGTFFFICTLFMALGTLYGPKLALKKGNIKTVILTQLLSLPFMLILAFTGQITLALCAFFMRATLMNMGHPLYHHFSMEIVEVREQATTNAFMGLSWNLGWLFGSWLGGYSIELHGFTPTILATAACYLGATFLQTHIFSGNDLVQIGKAEA